MKSLPHVLVLLALSAAPVLGERVKIEISRQASEPERNAAAELAAHLARTYSGSSFEVGVRAAKAGKAILLGTPASSPEILRFVPRDRLARPESFVVTSATRDGMPVGIVAGADARGALYGVYALLEKLGWGFYLSYEAAPPAGKEAFTVAGWNLADRPLFADRVIFGWQNFLSSPSAWELEDWQRWILGAVRMKYNTVMIHAYGNNPMFTFRHNGREKPIGYLATTQKGRDWGTQHVNDIRRIWGGDIFRTPVFGSSAALAPAAERISAAQALVRQALGFAHGFGLHVTFGVDVDTESANPETIVMTLPPSARIRSGRWQLANPDTPEGYAYWKAQVAQLLGTYPQIDRLVVWFRTTGTPWRNMQVEDFPKAWKTAYAEALAKDARLKAAINPPGMFAVARIASAFQKALDELGRKDVELGAGCWNYRHLVAMDAFFAPGVKLYWLDYSIEFGEPRMQALLRSIPRNRPMLPVVWAHHDDRHFVGRPYTPFSRFASLVEGTGTGFGIIHWTTRPLDMYFKSLGEQVWEATRNRPLAESAHEMAARSFGRAAAQTGGEYLLKWITEGRMFGRETRDRFMDVPVKDAAEVISRCRDRVALLDRVDLASLPPQGRERLRYYRAYEEFVAGFFQSHAAFERAQECYGRGAIEEARQALAESRPERVLESYRAAATIGTITRGEQAILITMNLRWLPYVESLRQALGTRPVRIQFEPTQHEPLAQGGGASTFRFDPRHVLWKGLGEQETGAPAFTASAADSGPCRSGIHIRSPLELKLVAIMGDRLAPGRYVVTVTLGSKRAILEFRGAPDAPPLIRRGDRRIAVPIDVKSGEIQLLIRPEGGTVAACAVTITPEGARP